MTAKKLDQIERITFIDKTNSKLTDIHLNGCGGGDIDTLDVGENKTVWIKINGDCSLYIDYLENGILKTEMVAGYLTQNMGQKAIHKIGGNNKEIQL